MFTSDITKPTIANVDLGLLSKSNLALFLDLDGTLAEIVDHPNAIIITDRTHDVLRDLLRRLDGAIAIVSGRSIEEIDRHTQNAFACVAGIHGLQRRDAQGSRHDSSINNSDIDELAARLDSFVAKHPGLHPEVKTASVALHYRKQPELKQLCHSWAEQAARSMKEAEILYGKMVVEIKLSGTHKGDAVLAFLEEYPFAGRTPLYVGDDVTDEFAFEVVNDMGGISIKVGEGSTIARYRVEDTSKLADWLHQLNINYVSNVVSNEEITGS